MELNPDVACALVLKLRRLNGKTSTPQHAEASNSVDDSMDEALSLSHDQGVRQDIAGLIAAMNEDERTDLAGLILLGSDALGFEDFATARQKAMEFAEPVFDFVTSQPLACEYLRAGLEKQNIACEGLVGAVRI